MSWGPLRLWEASEGLLHIEGARQPKSAPKLKQEIGLDSSSRATSSSSLTSNLVPAPILPGRG